MAAHRTTTWLFFTSISSLIDYATDGRAAQTQAIQGNRRDEQHTGDTPVSSEGKAASCRPFCSTASATARERAPDASASADDRVATEHGRGNRAELVTGPGVRSRLTDVGDVDHGRDAGHEPARTYINARPSLDWNAGVACASGTESDGVEGRPMTERCNRAA